MSKSNNSGAQHEIEQCQIELQSDTNLFNLPKRVRKSRTSIEIRKYRTELNFHGSTTPVSGEENWW